MERAWSAHEALEHLDHVHPEHFLAAGTPTMTGVVEYQHGPDSVRAGVDLVNAAHCSKMLPV
jgi:hypothetical protein